MRIHLIIGTLCVVGLAACASNTYDAGSGENIRLGVDTKNFGKQYRPQDDFYRYVNGQWLATTKIPADKSNYGSFSELFDKSEMQQRQIIEAAANGNHPAGSDAARIGAYYNAYMNEAAVEAAGATPLQPWFSQISNVTSKDALMQYFGAAQKYGLASPVGFWVDQDAGNTTQYIANLSQAGLSLPDRDYYLEDTEKYIDSRKKFVAHVERMFALAGLDHGASAAENILALEKDLANIQWARVRNRDRNATYNKVDAGQLQSLVPNAGILSFIEGAGLGREHYFVVRQPDYFTALGKVVSDTPLATWHQYMQWHLVNSAAPLLSHDFVEADFDFYGRTLRGVEENRPRWKRAVGAVNGALGEAVGKIFVKQTFAPESKVRMDKMVENLRLAFGQSIKTLAWMSEDTKQEAMEKLAKFTPKIGYPDKWKDYSDLVVTDDDLVTNTLNSAKLEYARELAKLGGPIDRTEWFMTPQTVNAYYNPSMNEIVFPAAILQPPFFNAAADDAVNYGGIGAVIGHEFSHGFDDQGRKSDGDGTLRDWWTEQDASEFKRRADGLVAQFSSFSPLEGEHVNGEFTLGENIGDLAGLTMAYRAYKLSLHGKEAPVIGGFTGDQRFFLGWAQVWRRLYRDEELRQRLVTDPHSPSEYRVNGIVANMPEFHRAFNVNAGDKLYRSSSEIIKIW